MTTGTAEGRPFSVVVDDLDPYRDVAARARGLTAAPRLSAEVLARWQQYLDEAWQLLARHHPERAASLAAGVTHLVPLADEATAGTYASFASPDAFGALSLTTPFDGTALADTLIHEFQHALLNGLLDLVPLHAGPGGADLYSPWRDDPRPFLGLLHGAYAYVGVLEFWSRQREFAPGGHADFEFARWRHQLPRAVDSLLGSSGLTPEGRVFVEGMSARCRPWTDVGVAHEPSVWGEECAIDHQLRWRLHNVVPDPALVEELVVAWKNGRSAPPIPPRSGEKVAPCAGTLAPHARLRLVGMRLSDAAAFAAAGPEALARQVPSAEPADIAHVQGGHRAAVAMYFAALATGEGTPDRWAGLAVARRRLEPPGEDPELLRTRPELVRAVHHATSPPRRDLLGLLSWFAGAIHASG